MVKSWAVHTVVEVVIRREADFEQSCATRTAHDLLDQLPELRQTISNLNKTLAVSDGIGATVRRVEPP